ncbi:hypothetical protein PMIN01_12943 [Paraphaeosphaeria minitans]|uniref:Uncharacterized protein n=1 Tax=Paraphaeosphaeria minitans TaxID=565426 RepID=A0A9P6G657_9PLEO|nr:hypothetical protein PMIN01_12943 [Paraphaeosphaeria minitans]
MHQRAAEAAKLMEADFSRTETVPTDAVASIQSRVDAVEHGPSVLDEHAVESSTPGGVSSPKSQHNNECKTKGD